jgi:hypothetical protein
VARQALNDGIPGRAANEPLEDELRLGWRGRTRRDSRRRSRSDVIRCATLAAKEVTIHNDTHAILLIFSNWRNVCTQS